MRKWMPFLLAILLVVSLTACGNGGSDGSGTEESAELPDDVYEVVISSEYLEWAGTDAETEAEIYAGLGEEYCTGAYASGEDLVLQLTDEQGNNLTTRNEEGISAEIEEFESLSDAYYFEAGEDYSYISFACDEDMDVTDLLTVILETALVYSLNYAIYNQAEWDTFVSIVNCHTGETAASGSFRYDTISISTMLWEASYYTADSSEPVYTNDDGEDVYQIRIDASYFSGISDTGADEYALDLSNMGSDYCTAAYEADGDLILEMTDRQIENYLALRDESTLSVAAEFESLSENYMFEGSEDYSSFTLYCDEDIDAAKLEELTTALIYLYSFNHALYAKTYWETYVYIINCNTGEIVSEGNVRYDTIYVSDEIWEATGDE